MTRRSASVTRHLATKVMPGKAYAIDEALKIVKDGAKAKFAESVDVAIRLGIDAKKSDQGVRGSVMLPHGTGKTVRVAVFCPAGEKAEAAKAAGADAVGMEDLAEKMQAGDLDFGRVIATPDAMRVVGKLGQLLGPRGLMPNPKDRLGRGRCRHRGQERQGGPGQVPQRQGRHRALHDRQGEFRSRCAEGKPQRAAGRPDEGQAGDREGQCSCRRCRCRARWALA